MGRCAFTRNDLPTAARYFERCYLSGAKFKEFAAQAWLEHGQVLEQQKKPEAAVPVYQALLAKRDYAALPAAAQARERLKSLTGGTP